MPQTTTLLGSADVCSELGNIDRSTLSRWVTAGRITPVMRLRGKRGAMLFDPKDVQRLKDALAVTKGRAA
jgi:predicted site-specific integrase-resolvase